MVVEVKNHQRRMTGLHVGDGNVQQFFPPDVPRIELELDHLLIVCALAPEFWDGDPAIHDERLVAWLEAKRMSGKLAAMPAPVLMIPTGDHIFRLQPIQPSEARTTQYPVSFAA